MTKLVNRIQARLSVMGLTERAASMRATGQPDALRYIRTRKHMPSASRLAAIAKALETSPAFLLGETNDSSLAVADGMSLAELRMKHDLPHETNNALLLDDRIEIYGAGDPFEFFDSHASGTVRLKGFHLDRTSEINIVDYPLYLKGLPGLYGFYQVGERGGRGDILIADPVKAPSIGDRVLGYLDERNMPELVDIPGAGEKVVLTTILRKAGEGYWISGVSDASPALIGHFSKLHRIVPLAEIIGA